ncbi:hypothetical protein THAOC_10901, partial [Thalassiosira oceanica]
MYLASTSINASVRLQSDRETYPSAESFLPPGYILTSQRCPKQLNSGERTPAPFVVGARKDDVEPGTNRLNRREGIDSLTRATPNFRQEIVAPGTDHDLFGSSSSRSGRGAARQRWAPQGPLVASSADRQKRHRVGGRVQSPLNQRRPTILRQMKVMSPRDTSLHRWSQEVHRPLTHRPDRLEEARDYWTIPSTADTQARGEGSLGDICNGSATYDTIGLRFDDIPTLGGVARDATKSVGGVSEITAPLHYIPTPSISVPHEKNLTEKTIKANSTPRANLLAGLKAADHPGQYVTAAEYLAVGRKQIGPRGWETNKPLSLQLYSEGASLAYRTGDINTMNALLDK